MVYVHWSIQDLALRGADKAGTRVVRSRRASIWKEDEQSTLLVLKIAKSCLSDCGLKDRKTPKEWGAEGWGCSFETFQLVSAQPRRSPRAGLFYTALSITCSIGNKTPSALARANILSLEFKDITP